MHPQALRELANVTVRPLSIINYLRKVPKDWKIASVTSSRRARRKIGRTTGQFTSPQTLTR